ncbi:Invasion protein IalB, involved in pathogenesis [Cohaesibacter gelatinilyticus]|uniref:Invasion protein IalB, involved in pathogenesis n=2 Tax=Cohaesibacter gelatinilyticus TaxID=372072 RepID=A0A285PBW3_9HYPH|nr:Invasion protein IalB, involved in pathogenesis [Cohaesibacter gelatinilyticus]
MHVSLKRLALFLSARFKSLQTRLLSCFTSPLPRPNHPSWYPRGRFGRGRGLGLGLALTLMLSLPASAGALLTALPQDASADSLSVHVMEDWQVRCETSNDKTRCGFSAEAQSAVSESAKRPVQLALSSLKQKGSKTILVLKTPLDLLLAKGIELRVDKQKPQKLAFRSCHQSGCVAPFALTSAMAKRLQRGNRLRVRVHDLSARPVDVEFSLSGFTAASRFADSQAGS